MNMHTSNAKNRALEEAAKSADPKLRKWAEDQKTKAAAGNPPELPQRPAGEASASEAGQSEPERDHGPRAGLLGSCADCGAPIDILKKRQPFHGPADSIVYTCIPCANIRWKAVNGFK